MAHVSKRKSAKRDLIERWVWYCENANPEIADRFLAAAEACANLIAKNPEIGIRTSTERPELQGLRRFPIKDGFEEILIFYFPRNDGMEMVRVVRGTRNISALLDKGQIR